MLSFARTTRIIRIVRLLRLVRMQEIVANVTERIQSETLGPMLQVSAWGLRSGFGKAFGRAPAPFPCVCSDIISICIYIKYIYMYIYSI